MTETELKQPITGAWDLTVPVRGQMYLAIALAALNSLSNFISLILIPLIARDIDRPNLVWKWVIGVAISIAISLVTRIFAFRVSHLAAFKLENILRTLLANENINAAVIEFVQGMQVVRTFDNGTSSFARYRRSLDIFTEKVRDWTESTILSGRIGTLLFKSLPPLLVVLGVGIYLSIQGTLAFPTLILFLLLATNLNTSLEPIMLLNSFINEARASALRIGAILTEPPLSQPTHPQVPQDASIAFKDVSFSYEPTRQILQNINLDLPAGTTTALVGLSGAGKTTLVRLIPRFWDVSSGAILLGRRSANAIGGVDLRQMTTDTLMSWVSFVFQETFLVDDSIRSNICLGKPDATIAEIEAAATAACAHKFILSLPDGYDTIVGERGARLSGGERQRITIARAILQNNPIVILDEATAFADPENELLIQQAIAGLTQGKTLIVIAHRLATIQNADRIIVLDCGCIAEQGKHQELLALNGLYSRLWTTAQTAQNWQLKSPAKTEVYSRS
jgi:ATP-binding cassette, subfamily B, bacterial IrtA/YbtP